MMKARTRKIVPFKRITLDEKLHELARLSPLHLRTVEMLVDMMLTRLRAETTKAVAR